MPRKRLATISEIDSAYLATYQRIVDSMVAPGALRTIRKRLLEIQNEYQIWSQVLWLHENLHRDQVRKLFSLDVKKLRAESCNVRLTVEDLERLMMPLNAAADFIAGKRIEPLQDAQAQALLGTLQRLSRTPISKARRFKPAFEKAFRVKTEASTRGEVISAVTLARHYTPYEYKRNPESALRAMQSGIKRVLTEHKRCVNAGIESPFLPEHQNSRFKSSRT